MDTLTKENFWDEMSKKYPKAMKHFGEWIDQYKKDSGWLELFNETGDGDCGNGGCGWRELYAPKYHELPIAMQFGIFLEYTSVIANKIRGKGMTFRVIVVLTGDHGRTIRKKITSFLMMREDKL